jgi:hypothetical protein
MGGLGSKNWNVTQFLEFYMTNNESRVSGAGETCAYGYDETIGADRYGGSYNYDALCEGGEHVGFYGIAYSGTWIYYVGFACYNQNGDYTSSRQIGNTGVSSYSSLTVFSISVGFYSYYQTLNSAAIAVKGQGFQINFGSFGGDSQTCQGDEKIVGFHGWSGSGLDESKIYCRKICNCAPGQYNNNGLCSTCPAGTFSSAAGAYSCSLCAAGKSSGLGSTSCTTCLAGSFSGVSAGSCSLCDTGKYS